MTTFSTAYVKVICCARWSISASNKPAATALMTASSTSLADACRVTIGQGTETHGTAQSARAAHTTASNGIPYLQRSRNDVIRHRLARVRRCKLS